MRLHHLLALFCAFGTASLADASFIYEQDDRALLTGYRVCDPLDCEITGTTELRPEPAFSDWSETLSERGATVSQTSTLGPTSMALAGSASALPFEIWWGSSRANIDFSVTEASLLAVTGELENVVFSLYRDAPTGQPILFVLPGDPIDFAGTLDAGHTYFLRVRAFSFSNDPDESFDITFSVSPIPEPASAVLLALGLAALASRMRS